VRRYLLDQEAARNIGQRSREGCLRIMNVAPEVLQGIYANVSSPTKFHLLPPLVQAISRACWVHEMKLLLDNGSFHDSGWESYAILLGYLSTGMESSVGNACTVSDFLQSTLQRLEDLTADVRERIHDTDGVEEKIEKLHHVLFSEERYHFIGNIQDYYGPANSSIDAVLARRQGIPLSLAIVYQRVAARLDINVDIIGLPGHIVVRVPDLDRHIDVFAGGTILTHNDLMTIIIRAGYVVHAGVLLRPLAPRDIVTRIYNNLRNTRSRLDLNARALVLHTISFLNDDPAGRDQGFSNCMEILANISFESEEDKTA